MNIRKRRGSELEFTKRGNGTYYYGPKFVNQFEIGDVETNVRRTWFGIHFEYRINMRRDYTNQIINTLFPTLLLWLLAYSTLFINTDNFNNRFMGSVTSLLVLTSLRGSINSGLPKTSYLKYIDVWFLWYTTSILLIIISHIAMDKVRIDSNINGKVLMVNSKNPSRNDIRILPNRTPKRELINGLAIIFLPILNLCFNSAYFYISV